MIDYRSYVEERQGARFSPRQWVEFDLYDCVTFIACVYQSAGVIGEITMPSYAVFGHGESMRDLTCQMIEETGGFDEVTDGSLIDGDAIVLSRGRRGHHTGIYLDGGEFAHCVRGRGVVIDSFVSPLSDHIFKIYRPI